MNKLAALILIVCLVVVGFITYRNSHRNFGSVAVTTINGSDTLSNSRPVINANFSNLTTAVNDILTVIATSSTATSTIPGNVKINGNLQVAGNFFAPVQIVSSGNATINGTLTLSSSLSGILNATAGVVATSPSSAFNSSGSSVIQPSFTITGTTTGAGTFNTLFGATTTLPLQQVVLGETINGVRCRTDAGTANVQFGNGSASTSLISASTTNNFNAYTTNNTPTAGQQFSVDVGTFSGPTKISCTLKITI